VWGGRYIVMAKLRGVCVVDEEEKERLLARCLVILERMRIKREEI
jgi:hypothetical protein